MVPPSIIPDHVVRSIPFLSQLPDELLQELTSTSLRIKLGPNQLVLREGDTSDSMYVVLSGRIRIYKKDPEGNTLELAVLQAGDFFGEYALLDNKPRSASVSCLTRCEFLVIRRQQFHDVLLTAGTGTIHNIFRELIGKLRDMNDVYFKENLLQRTLRSEAELERLRTVNQTVAGVAHELGTPLGVANHAASLIADNLSDPAVRAALEQNEYLRNILEDLTDAAALMTRNIAQAHHLIQDFKRTTTGHLNESLEALDMANTLRGSVDLFQVHSGTGRLQIKLDCSLPRQERIWLGYSGYLTQVMLNLLGNIEKYAYPNHGGRVIIRLDSTTIRQKTHFVLCVQDFGRGISPEGLKRVFDPFVSTSRGRTGSGLGLSIVRSIINGVMGGEITVASAKNVGTTFTLTLPQSCIQKASGGPLSAA